MARGWDICRETGLQGGGCCRIGLVKITYLCPLINDGIMMKVFLYLVFLFLLAILFQACAPVKKLDQLYLEAESALEAENKEAALLAYEEFIALGLANNMDVDIQVYNRAASLAYDLGDPGRAISLLDPFRRSEVATPETHSILARSYKMIDNLSLELSSLESYLTNFPDGEEVSDMRGRLFKVYVASNQMDKAVQLWDELEDSQRSDETLMTGFFVTQRALSDDVAATQMAAALLDKNPEHQEALEWLARRYFRQAESLYEREITAYENNRTHRQYARLLEAMEEVNTDLRIALSYFRRLWALDPSPEYARFLVNIYERFQDNDQAAYFRNYLR